jgi:hypothetical protein
VEEAHFQERHAITIPNGNRYVFLTIDSPPLIYFLNFNQAKKCSKVLTSVGKNRDKKVAVRAKICLPQVAEVSAITSADEIPPT